MCDMVTRQVDPMLQRSYAAICVHIYELFLLFPVAPSLG